MKVFEGFLSDDQIKITGQGGLITPEWGFLSRELTRPNEMDRPKGMNCQELYDDYLKA